ncbi:E3 ubiquitin-protein ligase ZNF598 [Neodiprion fabricii]|uniref:E3 ubiquitin-protein ligase ZNF598 n=1 Tax=Neodiprion fabricii TaxID=2872261 RepID=UPI001ED8EFEA|nr:E3 ubiquitin-protein ligase ZNF598 [Neodiprion fabricii]
MSKSEDHNDTDNACVVCFKNVEIYSIGMCEHPVCHDCSTRMRVLCCQNECPICRQDLPKVVFTREVKPFRHLRKGNLFDKRYNIYFDDEGIQERFIKLLAHSCDICKERQVFSNFNSLKDHMRRLHELHYCDLCVDNLKIFSHERRCYTRSDLAQHRRKGDVDDRSHKGHPLCEFCDQRYMDNDELFRHLRRDHLYCHFCDADGLHQYYSTYDYLRDHFRLEHFLCEEGPCAEEKFTCVFRSDIDLKAHKASIHGKQLGKAAAKQARTLELEFTLAPRGDSRNNRRMPGISSVTRNSRDHNSNRDYNNREYNNRDFEQEAGAVGGVDYFLTTNEPTYLRQPSVDFQSTQEFPTLGNATPVVPNLGQTKSRGNLTIRSTMRPTTLDVTDENFPALGPESSSASGTISKTVNLSVSSSNKLGPSTPQRQQSATSNVSIHVNHKPNGTVTTRVSGPNIRIRPAQLSRDSDFPALGNPEPSTNLNTAQWTKVTCTKTPHNVVPKSKKVAPPPLAPSPPIASGKDFPSLSKSSKSNKQSTISVVPSTPSWVQPQTSETNSAKATSDFTKGKTKKKKAKQITNSSNSSGNESSSSKSNSNASNLNKDKESFKNAEDVVKKENSASKNSTDEPKKVEDVKRGGGTSKSKAASAMVSEELKQNEEVPRKDNEQSKKEKKKSKNVSQINVSSMDNTFNSASSVNGNSSTVNAQPNTVQRKRSELKIDSLKSTNNNTNFEDFPALGSLPTRPPGFTEPPPGFGSAPPPPPGFFVTLNSVQRPQSNGLTFTNSSGQSYSILPNNDKQQDKHYEYVPPPDFSKRNKNLVAKVSEELGVSEAIEEFRYLSGLFRQGTCNAQDYYSRCRDSMGMSAFGTIFPELLVLLPDISKQQELFKIHKKESGSKLKGLDACATCAQVVKSGSDLRAHLSSHALENHFPVLGKVAPIQQSNSWVRK